MGTSGGDWMPTTWSGRAAMFQTVRDNIAGVAAALGLSAGQVAAAQDLCDEFLAVNAYYNDASAAASGLTEWRDKAMYDTKDEPLTDPPSAAPFVMPAATTTGIIRRFRDIRDNWVSLPGYTQAIGETLTIGTPQHDTRDSSTVTPLIQASAAQSGYLVGVIVSERVDADQWVVETRQGGGDWKNAGSFTGKSADITITPTTPGQPEQVEIRIRLRRKNADYGNLSQIATVTVNP